MLVQVNKWQSEKDYVLHHNHLFVWVSGEDCTIRMFVWVSQKGCIAFQLECLCGLVKRAV